MSNWFLLGDIHGSALPIENFYRNNKERLKLDDSENHIILLGDVACNYEITGKRDERFKQALSEFPFTYICLRGNHEARVTEVVRRFPDKWIEKEKYGGIIYTEKKFPKIEYLSDSPAIYEFAGYKTLSIPGAYSVDKWVRLRNHWQWFPDEQLTEKEMQYGRDIIAKEKTVELVISHTCPILFEPTDLFLAYLDQSQVDKTMERYLGEIEATLDYKRWAWGHFHDDRLYPWDGDKEKLMLLNERVIDLVKFMEMKKTDYFEDIMA